MGDRILEHIHHFNAPAVQVRVWAAATDLRSEEERLLQQKQILEAMQKEKRNSAAEVAEAVAALPFCNAVEVTSDDMNGGVLIYPSWP